MASVSKPDRLVMDAYSDPNIKSLGASGVYSRFTNALPQGVVGVRGLQLLRTNFVNSTLQLNDYNGQLFFLYYKYTDATATGIALANMHCVRLHPSWFVPKTSFTNFVKNKYFNTVTELVAALNAAAVSAGDSTTYNPTFLTGDITFSYDTATRRISFVGNTASSYYSPVAFDDPNVALFFNNNASYTPKMNAFNSSSSYATATYQPWISGNTMNPRLGFAMSINTRGVWAGSGSIRGCATSTQVPSANGTTVEADSWPILIGAQNLNVFCSILGAGGQSSGGRKNLLACIPLETAGLNVASYTLSSVEGHVLSVAFEIYEITLDFTDDFGNPFFFPPNYNVQVEMNLYYKSPIAGENGKTYYPASGNFTAPHTLNNNNLMLL